jgi:hypothetical protein
MDGDRGKPNHILYSLVNGESGQLWGYGSNSLGLQNQVLQPLWALVPLCIGPGGQEAVERRGQAPQEMSSVFVFVCHYVQ